MYVTEPDGHREVKVEASGFGARKPQTVHESFKEVVKKFPGRNAMAIKRAAPGVSIACMIWGLDPLQALYFGLGNGWKSAEEPLRIFNFILTFSFRVFLFFWW